MHNFMTYFKMNSLAWNNALDNTFADNRNWGCLDEFWYVTDTCPVLFVKLSNVTRASNRLI